MVRITNGNIPITFLIKRESDIRRDIFEVAGSESIFVEPIGKIIIEPGINIWSHELKTAESLAKRGFTIEFVKKRQGDHEKSPDILMNGSLWEIKAPTASNLKAVERNLKRGRWQSSNLVFDCRRMKKLPEQAIRHEVEKQTLALSGIDHVLYITKSGEVITIK